MPEGSLKEYPPPSKRLILGAVLRKVSPMVIRILAVPDSLLLHEFDALFRAVLSWDRRSDQFADGLLTSACRGRNASNRNWEKERPPRDFATVESIAEVPLPGRSKTIGIDGGYVRSGSQGKGISK
jgi:hypothetical protein